MPLALESSICNTIIKKLNAVPGCRVKKFHGSPFGKCELDIYGCYNGVALFIEVKRPGCKPTIRQNKEIEDWRAVGAISGFVTGAEGALSMLRDWDNEVQP